MKMLHIEKPDTELHNEIIKIWPYGMFELWDNGDIVIPVNKTAHIRKIMGKRR